MKIYILSILLAATCATTNYMTATDLNKEALHLRAFVADEKLASEVFSGAEPASQQISQHNSKAHFLVIQTKNETGLIVWGKVSIQIPGVHDEYTVTILDTKSAKESSWATTIIDLGGINIKAPTGTPVTSRWKKIEYK